MEIKYLGLIPIMIFIIWALGYEDDFLRNSRLSGFYWDNVFIRLLWILVISLTVGGIIWAFS